MQRWTHNSLRIIVGWLALVGIGCAHTISEGMRQQATPPIPFKQLHADPEAYKERVVILGGRILEVHNTDEGTRLEILQKPLTPYEQPQVGEYTEGRFMADCEIYLDPAVYTTNRDITIAGRVLGAYEGQVDEATYLYPLISCQEIRLWPERVVVETVPYDYTWGYWGPWWYWQPYPYYGRPYYRHHRHYHHRRR